MAGLLRADLKLIREEITPQGWLQYVVLDPIRNKYFRLPQESLIHGEQGLEVSSDYEDRFASAELLKIDPPKAQALQKKRLASAAQPIVTKVLKNYLFLKRHIINPDKILDALYLRLSGVFSLKFLVPLIA